MLFYDNTVFTVPLLISNYNNYYYVYNIFVNAVLFKYYITELAVILYL